jgi:hypothetical protein
MQQTTENIKIIKLLNGEDVVCVLPIGDKQLPQDSKLMRLERPLLIKYVPQMTLSGFKDYIALIRWCSYTPDQVITIPKDKIIAITNASIEMANSYINVANSYNQKPVPIRNNKYKKQRLTDDENEKINEIFDEFDDDDFDKTIH